MTNTPWEPEDFRLVFGSSKIGYNRNKEAINRKDHKYSLESAVYLLQHLMLPIKPRPFITRDASTTEERRHEHMTIDDSNHIVFMVTTMRDDETIRVISLRRAHKKEREVFTYFTGYKEVSSKK